MVIVTAMLPPNVFHWLPLAAIALLAWAPLALEALQIDQFDPDRHHRFVAGTFPNSPETNPGLWVASHSFHGVGWSANDPRRGFALISPRHFVGANHFRPTVGTQIRFVGMDGQLRSYTYAKFYNLKNDQNQNTDLFIGELAEDIPASHRIPFYPILDLPEAEFTGREIIVYGSGPESPRIGRGIIEEFEDWFGPTQGSVSLNDTRNFRFRHVSRTAHPDDAYGEIGDSGSPSFVLADGLLTIAGVHAAISTSSNPRNGTTTTTYDSFVPHYRDQIDAHLAATGHRLTLAPLGDTTLRISSVHYSDGTITLHVENPSDLPFEVQSSTELTGGAPWVTVATAQRGPTWSGPVPPEAVKVFWRIARHPTATVDEEG